MRRRTIIFVVLVGVALVAMPIVSIYGLAFWNDHLRVRDAEPAFRPIESLGCHILSQPYGSRYCRYLVTFPPETLLSDSNAATLSSLNKLPKGNTLDVEIPSDRVTDASIPHVAAIETVDTLDVTESGISNDGIEQLKKRMPATYVLERR
jgi:hypothetical protein